ncbi:13623_t:CDS:2 [Cetraspora pellucida]|uniref:13623_t:CDS:1 n=1 Tax=Cetraspora pellucida TaxID=1433469 RepID=A0ACA9K8W7_9GLOM|nr:13623_t:CDS:2 [Cetraspora pellucida]
MSEFKFPDIQMPEFDFSNVGSSISTIIMIIVICLVVIIISYCLITVCARCCCGFGADEIAEGSCAAMCQSAGATGVPGRYLTVRVIVAPNIINFIGWFISRDAFYLIVDYHEGGTLADCIPPNGRDEYSTLNLMIQVFDAVKYIHDHGIAHCDIKPENILLSSDRKRLILADFGHSQLECDDLIKDPEYFKTKSEASKVMKGTAGFYSPERDPREHIPFKGFKKADMYSLGVTIYVVLTYHLPFDPTQSIRHQSLLFPDHISLPAQHFIQNLLSIDPSRRMIISDCFNHSWLRIHDISGRRPKQSLNDTNNTNQPKKFYKINHNIFSRRKHFFNQKNCDIG